MAREHNEEVTLTRKGRHAILNATRVVGILTDHNHADPDGTTYTCEDYGCRPADYWHDHDTGRVYYALNGPSGERWVTVSNPPLADAVREASKAKRPVVANV